MLCLYSSSFQAVLFSMDSPAAGRPVSYFSYLSVLKFPWTGSKYPSRTLLSETNVEYKNVKKSRKFLIPSGSNIIPLHYNVFASYKMWGHLKSADFTSSVKRRMLIFLPWKWKSDLREMKFLSVSTFTKSKKLQILSFLYRASFQHMEWKPTDVTILFVYCWISTCFGPTGQSSGEFVQLFTQPLVQFLCSEHANRAAQKLNQWLCEQLYELSWRWACGPETCRDPAIYE